MAAHVPSIIPATVFRVATRLGIDGEELVDGLDTPLNVLSSPGRPAPWDDVAHLYQRLEVVRPGCASEFGEAFAHGLPLLSFLAAYVHSPHTFVELVAEGSKRLWYFMDCRFQRLPDGGMEWTTKLPAPHVACEPFFRSTTRLLAVLPRLVNHDEAHVEGETGPRHGHWRIRLATPRNASKSRGSTASRVITDVAREMMELVSPKAKPTRELAWPLSIAEQRVVALLARGKTTDAIAKALDISKETVRSHLKRSMGKLGVHRQHELVVKVLERKHSAR